MKFLCVECDEPMKFDQFGGMDDDGSLSVTFRCPSCEWGVTMLTNPQETQMVRSLGVQIGGERTVPAPMAMLRQFMPFDALDGVDGEASPVEASATGASKCPFAKMIKDMDT